MFFQNVVDSPGSKTFKAIPKGITLQNGILGCGLDSTGLE
jgi:hypothetical protein